MFDIIIDGTASLHIDSFIAYGELFYTADISDRRVFSFDIALI